MHVLRNLLLLLALGLVTQYSFAFTVGNKMEHFGLRAIKKGLGTFHRHVDLAGHEEITRQAIIQANTIAAENNLVIPEEIAKHTQQNLKSERFGIIGSEALNPLIQGNYATDFPFTRNDYAIKIPEYWGFTDVEDNMDWQNHPLSQKYHFLRNHMPTKDERGSLLVSERKSCFDSREAIIKVTQDVLTYFRKQEDRELNIKKALFLIGHATHMIQDSFSHAHGRRDGRDNNFNVSEMCYFGSNADILAHPFKHKKRYKSCHHSLDEMISDGIWMQDFANIRQVKKEWPNEAVVPNTAKGLYTCIKNYSRKVTDPEACLKHTPRLARTATAKYLVVLMLYMNTVSEIEATPEHLKNYLITNFFEGSLGLKNLDETMPNGIMRCEGLPE